MAHEAFRATNRIFEEDAMGRGDFAALDHGFHDQRQDVFTDGRGILKNQRGCHCEHRRGAGGPVILHCLAYRSP